MKQELVIAKYAIEGCVQSLEMATSVAKQKLQTAQTEEEIQRAKEMLMYSILRANEELNKIIVPTFEEEQTIEGKKRK